MNTVARTTIIGEVAEVESKRVNDKTLIEFRFKDYGPKVNAWGDLSEKVGGPGSILVVEGKMQTRRYEVDGKPRSSTEVTASTIEVLKAVAAPAPAADNFDDGDDLPF